MCFLAAADTQSCIKHTGISHNHKQINVHMQFAACLVAYDVGLLIKLFRLASVTRTPKKLEAQEQRLSRPIVQTKAHDLNADVAFA